MYKFTGPAARAALVAGLVSVLGTGYAAYAADHPVPASPHSTCAPPSVAGGGKGSDSGSGPEAAPRLHYAHLAIAEKRGEQLPGFGSTEEQGWGPETAWPSAPTGTPPKQTPTPTTTTTVKPTWGEQTPPASSPPTSTPPTGSPTSPPASPPATWTSTPTPTHPASTPPQHTTPGTPGTSSSPSTPSTPSAPPAPPHLAHTGAGSKASLLGALSAGAVVTGAAAVALSRRASRSKCEK